MDNLNIFKKYDTKSNYHEDQLTLNYLLLLTYSKYSQIQLLNYIRNEMKSLKINDNLIPQSLIDGKNDLQEIKTQISTNSIIDYSGRLVSILITDDKIEYKGIINISDRKGILDGLLVTDDGFIFTIENKPRSSNVWFDQLSFSFPDTIEYEKTAIILSWREIVNSLNIILQNNLASFIENKLIEDFLFYVYEYFPYLNPFDSFKICKNNDYLLEKRCFKILENLSLGAVTWHKGWHYSIKLEKPELKEIILYHDNKKNNNWELYLELYPGDVMNQSRELYKKIDKVKLLNLLSDGWNIESNFHFSFRSSGLLWTNTTTPIENYIGFWQSIVKKNELNQVKRKNWDSYLIFLIKNGIMDQNDLQNFNENIKSKGYTNLNICPGIRLWYKWDKNSVIDLDYNDNFVHIVKEKIEQVLSCW